MADAASRATAADDPITGATVIAALKAAGVEIVVALPDLETCEALLWPIRSDPDLRLVQVCKEDEGVSICAALSYCEKRAILSMQHTGFLDSINAIHHIPVNYGLPVIMIVGLQGLEAGQSPEEAERPDIRFVIPALKAMGLAHTMLDREMDGAVLTRTIDACYASSKPHVFLFGRRPV